MRPRRESVEEVANDRPRRTPVSANRDILAVSNIPEDKVGRWVNDDGDRIMRFLNGGWEFVTDTGVCVGEKTVEASKGVGQTIHRLVGTKANNSPLYAYLMVISKEWYNEDQDRKQEDVDASEDAIYERLTSRKNGNYGNFETEFK